jgi:class 3 adenylate cyclase
VPNQPPQHLTDESDAIPATFMFADIAGFTALTEAHGDQEAAKLVDDFCGAVEAELPSFGGTQVKTIGDALPQQVAKCSSLLTKRC